MSHIDPRTPSRSLAVGVGSPAFMAVNHAGTVAELGYVDVAGVVFDRPKKGCISQRPSPASVTDGDHCVGGDASPNPRGALGMAFVGHVPSIAREPRCARAIGKLRPSANHGSSTRPPDVCVVVPTLQPRDRLPGWVVRTSHRSLVRLADGELSPKRPSMVVIRYDSGLQVRGVLALALTEGWHGRVPRQPLRGRAPLGLRLKPVSCPPDSDYFGRRVAVAVRELEERLRPVGARVVGRGHGNWCGDQLDFCAMGVAGVVNEGLHPHDVENLYVACGLAFPSYGALQSTLTIAARGVRVGRHVATNDAGARG